MRIPAKTALTLTLLACALGAQAQSHNATVDFSNGTQGWEGHWDGLYSNIDTSLGNPVYRTQFTTHNITFVNSSNAAFTGDFSQGGSLSFGIDINVLEMRTPGEELTVPPERDLILELRDYDRAVDGMPYSAVWINLGSLTIGQGWQHMSATIANPLSSTLQPGWHGLGAFDPETGEDVLPEGVSFADILKGVDQIAFTTAKPGWAYNPISFDVMVDNISVSAVPEPATLLLQALGLATLAGVERRRRQAAPRA